MKKIFILAFVCLAALQTAAAQSFSFLQIPQDPAVAGMAGAGVAIRSISPLDNNLADAALAQEKMAVSASYTLWTPSVNSFGLIGASASYRVIPKLVVALSVKDFMSPAYELASTSGLSEETFKPMDLAIGLGAAYQLGESLALGAAAKFVRSSLAPEVSKGTVAFNLSAKYAANGLQAGLALDNLGSGLPTTVRAGAAYSIAGLTASLEGDYVLNAGMMAGAGLQYGIKDMVFVRAGYHLGLSDKVIPSHVSLGVGLNFSGFRLDVSYLTASKTLGNTLAFGLGYAF